MGEPTAEIVGRRYLGKQLGHWMVMGACGAVGSVGLISSVLLTRVYFYWGGQQKWLVATLQTIGWPVLIPPLVLMYYLEARAGKKRSAFVDLQVVAAATDAGDDSVGTGIAGKQQPSVNAPGSGISDVHRAQSIGIMTASRGDSILPVVVDTGRGMSRITVRDLRLARARIGTRFTPRLIAALVALGALASLDSWLFACGFAYLPVSTASLLTSTQLAFSAVFSWALLRHRFTAGSANAVFAISLGSALVGLHAAAPAPAAHDMPPHTTRRQYVLAAAATVGASALWGLLLPLVQLTYRSVARRETLCVILEGQAVLSAFGTAFSVGGMAAAREIPAPLLREAAAGGFRHGPAAYAATLAAAAVSWQLSFLGAVGLVFSASALLSSVVGSALFPAVTLVALAAFHDEFSVLKVAAVVLSVWGIMSYAYGGYAEAKRQSQDTATVSTSLPLQNMEGST